MRHTRDTLYSMLGLTTAPCAETFDKHAQKPVPVNQSLRLNSLFVLFAASLAWLTPAAWLLFPTLPTFSNMQTLVTRTRSGQHVVQACDPATGICSGRSGNVLR